MKGHCFVLVSGYVC